MVQKVEVNKMITVARGKKYVNHFKHNSILHRRWSDALGKPQKYVIDTSRYFEYNQQTSEHGLFFS